jgi:sulfatase maturation enzyme AslB (radical SAM superfamily)
MTLAEAQKIFPPKFVKQLSIIQVNGNFGDAVMNHETVDILRYFRLASPNVHISMSTNGGARNKDYWESLARLNVTISFCLDGLEDTHSLYRQNTLYSTVIQNAKIFIAAGGRATWKMIKFDHNQHQIDQAQKLSQQMGFDCFQIVDQGRDQGPVFNQQGKLVHVIGNPTLTDFDKILELRTNSEVLLEDLLPYRKPSPITCQVKQRKSIYVSSTGDVYPCCYLGFSPKTYGHGNYHAVGNSQFRDFVVENNALDHDLAHCISWFSKIENTWDIPTFEQGRLIICNDVCGKAKNPNK